MGLIALILGALALVVSAPLETPQAASRGPEPGFAPTAEACLTEPWPTFGLSEPAREPGAPRDWTDCTADEARQAIHRQCALDEQPGTIAHDMCLSRREETDARRRSDAMIGPDATASTTHEDADRACRGQTWRGPGETRQVCIDRLIATDALAPPLPQSREPAAPRCRRESVRSEDGSGFSVSVRCTETTVVQAQPR